MFLLPILLPYLRIYGMKKKKKKKITAKKILLFFDSAARTHKPHSVQ